MLNALFPMENEDAALTGGHKQLREMLDLVLTGYKSSLQHSL